MAVCAQQDALPGLGSYSLERSGQSSVGKPKALRFAVDVVELQRTDVAVVPAEAATPAGVGHEDLLQLSPPSRHGFRTTAQASVNASTLQPEEPFSMPWARHDLSVRIHAARAGGVRDEPDGSEVRGDVASV